MKRYNPYKAAALNMQKAVADDAILNDVDLGRKAKAQSLATSGGEVSGDEPVVHVPVEEPEETPVAEIKEPGEETPKSEAVERIERYFNPRREKRVVKLDGKHRGQDGRVFQKRQGK